MAKETRTTATAGKPYGRMNAAELGAATAEFDRVTANGPRVGPAPADAAARLAAAMSGRRRAPGRPVVGEGAERINVTVERGLLRTADNFADAHGLTRSELIAEALQQRLGLAATGTAEVAVLAPAKGAGVISRSTKGKFAGRSKGKFEKREREGGFTMTYPKARRTGGSKRGTGTDG